MCPRGWDLHFCPVGFLSFSLSHNTAWNSTLCYLSHTSLTGTSGITKDHTSQPFRGSPRKMKTLSTLSHTISHMWKGPHVPTKGSQTSPFSLKEPQTKEGTSLMREHKCLPPCPRDVYDLLPLIKTNTDTQFLFNHTWVMALLCN